MNKFESVNEMVLEVIEMNGEKVIDSREVSLMVEKEHFHLLRDIESYIKILGKSNFGLSDFFIEGRYINSQNKVFPMYYLTKKGCDMVANKMTGEKGILFTAAYVTAFEQMQKQFKPLSQLEVLQQSLNLIQAQQERIEELDKDICNVGDRVVEHEQRLTEFMETARIDTHQEFALGKKATNKVLTSLGGRTSLAYKGSAVYDSLSKKTYAQFWRDLKSHFMIARKGDLAKKDFTEAMSFISYWQPSTDLRMSIDNLNKIPVSLQNEMPF